MSIDAQPAPARGRLASRTFIALVALAAGGAAVGAWFDWTYWHPSSALALYLAIPVLVAIGVVLALIGRLPAVIRFGAFAIAAGIIGGSVLGPSRAALTQRTGAVVISLTRPQPVEIGANASCQTTESGDQLSVASDANGAFGEGEDRVFVSLHVTRGDMFQAGEPRPDGLGVEVTWAPARIDEANPAGSRMRSVAGSTLDADIEALSGTLTFSGLALDPNEPGGTPLDIAGTVRWSCDG